MGIIQWKKLAGTFLVCMVLTGLLATRAKADGFPWFCDPNSMPFVGGTSVSGNDLFRTFGAVNTGTTAHDIGLIIPIANTNINSMLGNLAWDQTQGGWSGSVGGNSLLITVTSPTGLLPWSNVADATGLTQQTVSTLNETTNPADSYPFIDFGVLLPGQTASITWDFHFNWGGSGSGVTERAFYLETIAPNPNFVPEPSTLALLAAGMFGLMAALIRKKVALT